ncbi:type VI secretion system contractile sheath large subunit [Bremerella sp. T1]|uniref:type VI secretion system contractile sheath large subunit n=1 Tax=Bremerella sp. TYQ1 TaxID=3119568 RepID=UPI001CCE4426|nr:type VI secretion system contractile sheath large subunit [Bremerella volcania]UBM33677.1 type VI secretion system contractile sheath large subunit [Bremerella volcania]
MSAKFQSQPEDYAEPLTTEASPQDSPEIASEADASGSILDWIVSNENVAHAQRASHRWDDFIHAPTVREKLLAWLGKIDGLSQKSLVRRLNADVAQIDQWLNDQLNAILHHPQFQRLEASWRGLQYLTDMVDEEADREQVHIRVLNASWKEVERDIERAVEFDSSELFKKIYEEEFGTAGGKPYGVMIGDYEIHPNPTKNHPHRDLDTLQGLAGIAAAAFCPFIAAASPMMFGLDDYAGLEHVENLRSGFDQAEFTQWHAFRKTEDSRFVALTMPHVLMRLPYETFDARADGFSFREEVSGRDRRNYLWGNASYAFAEVLIRAYSECGWLAQIRGVQRNIVGGGLVSRLPVDYFHTDRHGVAPKSSTDCLISDRQEAELAHLGFIPLTHCHDTEFSAFYSNQTVQKPRVYEDEAASQNAKISSMLQYILCSSQFAHALKVIARDKVGTFEDRQAIEQFLSDWIHNYVTPDEKASPETKASRPLRQADIQLRDDPSKPGSYHCNFRLWPHYQLDDLVASIRMKTTIEGRRK